jgi:hypothetical protein
MIELDLTTMTGKPAFRFSTRPTKGRLSIFGGGMLALVVLALSAASATAQGTENQGATGNAISEAPDWTFSRAGFGTLGAVYHNVEGVEFRRDQSQAYGAAAGHINFAPDSILGVQLSASLRKTFEASMQVTSRLDAEGSYRPSITLAFLKYRPVEDAAFRVGRLANEMYLQSDSADIGFANVTIRQPTIFYPRTFNGGDGEWVLPVYDGSARVKVFAGWTTGKLRFDRVIYDMSGSPIRGAVVEYVKNGWTGRIASGSIVYDRPVTDPQTAEFIQALRTFAPNGNQVADWLDMKNRRIDYQQAALAYDSDGWQGMVSYARDKSPTWPCRSIAYGMVGYRFGAWTPYLSYTDEKTNRDFLSTGLPPGNVLAFAAGIAQAAARVNQTDLALGTRYDLTQNLALKFQWNRIRYQDPKTIVDPSRQTIAAENRPFKVMDLWSATLDFLF